MVHSLKHNLTHCPTFANAYMWKMHWGNWGCIKIRHKNPTAELLKWKLNKNGQNRINLKLCLWFQRRVKNALWSWSKPCPVLGYESVHKSGAHFPIRSSSSRLRYRRHPRIRGERSARAPASVWSFRTVVISFLFIIVLSLKGICQVIPGLQSLGLLSGQINFCGNPLCLRYHLGNVGLMESLYNTLCSALLGEGSGAARHKPHK